MMKKLGLVIGIGIGYVLGTRAGRGRYEQLSQSATKLWNSPQVQQAAEQAKDLAAEAAGQAKDMAVEATANAGQTVKDTVADVRDAAKEKVQEHKSS